MSKREHLGFRSIINKGRGNRESGKGRIGAIFRARVGMTVKEERVGISYLRGVVVHALTHLASDRHP
jgi:hypothetical protein